MENGPTCAMDMILARQTSKTPLYSPSTSQPILYFYPGRKDPFFIRASIIYLFNFIYLPTFLFPTMFEFKFVF